MDNSSNSTPNILIILLIISLLGIAVLFYLNMQNKETVNTLQTQMSDLNIKYNALSSTQTTTPEATSSATPTPESTAWKTYTNDKYGFTLSFGDAWKGYQVKEETIKDDKGSHFRVYVPTTDKQFSSTNSGYADPFVISVYTLADWDNVLKQEGTKPTLIQKDNNYAYAYSSWQACPQDLCSTITSAEIKNIIKTFNLNK
jgi:hypothetical protein